MTPSTPDLLRPARDAAWYNQDWARLLNEHADCTLPPRQSIYFPLWAAALQRILPGERIADFGCACGQFAQLCYEQARPYVLGVDHSSTAILAADRACPAYRGRFVLADLRNPSIFGLVPYEVACFFEVLEHIEDDLAVLTFVPADTKILLSVPSFDYEAHTRFYATEAEWRERFRGIVEIVWTRAFPRPGIGTMWLMEGFRC